MVIRSPVSSNVLFFIRTLRTPSNRAITNFMIDATDFIWLVIPSDVPKVVLISISNKFVMKVHVCQAPFWLTSMYILLRIFFHLIFGYSPHPFLTFQ